MLELPLLLPLLLWWMLSGLFCVIAGVAIGNGDNGVGFPPGVINRPASLVWPTLCDINDNLNVDRCSPELRDVVGASREPYRVICNQLEKELEETIEMLQVC